MVSSACLTPLKFSNLVHVVSLGDISMEDKEIHR